MLILKISRLSYILFFILVFSIYFLIIPNSPKRSLENFDYSFNNYDNFDYLSQNNLIGLNNVVDYTNNINNDLSDIVFKNAYSLNQSFDLEEERKKKIEKEIAYKNVLNINKEKNTFKYKVKKGDSLEKIAKKFGLKIKELKAVNNLKNDKIIAGQIILIPQSVKISAKITNYNPKSIRIKASYVNALTEIGGILIPTNGLNQKKIHSNNGVDISSPCGTPVYSAESGIVITTRSGYNSGYGNYILIQHNNFETLYGHLSNIYVKEGDYVNKGELIGTVGNTGYTIGETGCHLHFETRGLKNPLAE